MKNMLTPYILVIVNILRKTELQTRGGPWFYFFHHQDKGWKVGGGPGEQSRVNNDLNQFDTFSLLFHLEALRGALFSFDLLRSTWAPASSTHQCSYATLSIENKLSIQYCKNHQLGPKKNSYKSMSSSAQVFRNIPGCPGPTYILLAWVCENYNVAPPLDRA